MSALRHSQKTNRSRYGGVDPPLSFYEFNTGQVFDIPSLRAIKRSRTGSGVIVGVSGHETRWPQEIQFASITSCESEWLELGDASGSGGGPKVVIIEPPVLENLELLFKRDTR